MCLLIRGEFAGFRSQEVSYGRCVYSTSGELTDIRSPEVSVYSFMESLLVSRVQEVLMEMCLLIPGEITDIESTSFIWKMCLLIRGEFTGIRSPGVCYGRCAYSSMESLLVSGVQEFHMEDAFTHPRRVYWYQESRISTTKMCLLIHGEFTGIRSPKVPHGRCVYSSTKSYFLLLPGSHELFTPWEDVVTYP
jgi:hypothetical protein